MSGDHYFSARPGSEFRPKTIRVALVGREVEVATAGGVFSPDRLDTGTAVLLEAVPSPPPSGDLLDVGCGWGPVALSLAIESPQATVWAVDVNERSLDLTRQNAARLGLTNVNAVLPEDVPPGLEFAAIWSNPPIRVGKAELHRLLGTWLPRLQPDSDAWLVVQKNLGADSLQRWLDAEFPAHAIIRAGTARGYRVLRARRRG